MPSHSHRYRCTIAYPWCLLRSRKHHNAEVRPRNLGQKAREHATSARRQGSTQPLPDGKEGPLRGAGVRKLGLVLFKPC